MDPSQQGIQWSRTAIVATEGAQRLHPLHHSPACGTPSRMPSSECRVCNAHYLSCRPPRLHLASFASIARNGRRCERRNRRSWKPKKSQEDANGKSAGHQVAHDCLVLLAIQPRFIRILYTTMSSSTNQTRHETEIYRYERESMLLVLPRFSTSGLFLLYYFSYCKYHTANFAFRNEVETKLPRLRLMGQVQHNPWSFSMLRATYRLI